MLGGCSVTKDYSYDFTPTSSVERDAFIFRERQELRVWLPFAHGRLGGELSDEHSVGVAMLTAGLRRLKDSNGDNVGRITRDMLVGDSLCNDATHYISAIYIGAFRFATVDKEVNKISFESFIFGVSAGSNSEINVTRSGGNFKACSGSEAAAGLFDQLNINTGGARPLSGCDVALRVELTEISPASASPSAHPIRDAPRVQRNGGESPRWRSGDWALRVGAKHDLNKARVNADFVEHKSSFPTRILRAVDPNSRQGRYIHYIFLGAFPNRDAAEREADAAKRVLGEGVMIVNISSQYCQYPLHSNEGYDYCE